MPYKLADLQSDVAQVQHLAAGFGSGRLIATNLVLTAAHLLWKKEDNSGPCLDGWEVRIARHRAAGRWPFQRGALVVWYDRDQDLALLKLTRPKNDPLRPRL